MKLRYIYPSTAQRPSLNMSYQFERSMKGGRDNVYWRGITTPAALVYHGVGRICNKLIGGAW